MTEGEVTILEAGIGDSPSPRNDFRKEEEASNVAIMQIFICEVRWEEKVSISGDASDTHSSDSRFETGPEYLKFFIVLLSSYRQIP